MNDSYIIVRFICSHGFIGRAISSWTNSLFDHVEFGTPEGTWIGAHAKGGVQERSADYCDPFRDYTYRIPCSAAKRDELLAWARSKIGTRYNFRDILGLLMHNRTLTNPNRLICSQFVCEGLLTVFGAKQVLNVLPDYTYLVTPEMLHLSPIFVGNLYSRKG